MTQQPDDLVEQKPAWWMQRYIETQAATITELRQRVAELEGEAKFLCDRIDQLDWSMDFEDFARDFTGHVEPSWERLRSIIRNRSNDHAD